MPKAGRCGSFVLTGLHQLRYFIVNKDLTGRNTLLIINYSLLIMLSLGAMAFVFNADSAANGAFTGAGFQEHLASLYIFKVCRRVPFHGGGCAL